MKDGVLLRQVLNIIDELDFSDYNEIHAFGDIYESILKELQSAGSASEFYTPRAVTDFMAKMIKPKIEKPCLTMPVEQAVSLPLGSKNCKSKLKQLMTEDYTIIPFME